MHMIVMLTIAAYTFTKNTFAIINLVKMRKGSSARLIALRNISLADSCVSIFALQRSMLVSFPGMADGDIRIMNAVFGSVICIIVFILGYNLKHKIKQIRQINDGFALFYLTTEEWL